MTTDDIKRLIAEATDVVTDDNEDLQLLVNKEAAILILEGIAPDLAAQVVRLTEALKNVMGIVDTPIGWRRLGADVNNCEWLQEARAALGERK